jgi:Uma2 family endonuclease
MVETLPKAEIIPALREADEAPPAKRLLTREEYHKMSEAGIFGPDERVELLFGEVYKKMSPQSPRHASLIRRLEKSLGRVFNDDFECRSQLPLRAGAESEPEPDICIVPGPADDYWDEHPKAADAALIVEIADRSLRTDRGAKAALYAEAGVKDYWIVNVRDRIVEVYREPRALEGGDLSHGYTLVRLFRNGDTLSPLAAPEARLAVGDLLPPR